jgi:hypothetical protein
MDATKKMWRGWEHNRKAGKMMSQGGAIRTAYPFSSVGRGRRWRQP